MAAQRSRWLFLSLSLVLIIYIRDLLGQTSGKVVEADIRVKVDTPGVLSFLESQLDSFTSPIVESNGDPIEGRLPSPVLASEPLTFDPPSLDFEDQSVGMPQLFTVKVINPSRTQNLHLNSISGESHVFHPSFFKSKVVKAGENEWTTFDVVFLPRGPGLVRDTLYIHTSHGTFDFKVQGVGVPNPFRMRPLLGAKIPLNATYSPLITMYNPFETTLQITEMYSSGGDLHLELLSGQLQGSKSLWEIRPYETKPIARANFFGREAVNHTSFIRVKTNLGDTPSIVLPVEVEVSETTGLYLSRELLDFGILKSGETKSLPLFVLNSSPHTVHIKSISVVPENPTIEVEPTVTFLKPGLKYLKIASVTLSPKPESRKQQESGHLEILAEDDRRMEYRLHVPYDSTILHGTLAFERSQTMFRVGKPPFDPLIRNISLANQFSVPLVLYDIRLSSKAQEYFTVLDFHGPFTLPATSEWHRPFALQFQPTSSECLFNTTLRLSTNASLFNIPFFCYDGRVTYMLNSTVNPGNEDVLDYGVLSESDSVSKHFFLINPNPIRITIVSFLVSDSIPFTSVELLQIKPANMSVEGAEDRVQIIGKKQGAKGPFYVEPDMVALFRVNITSPKKLGTFTGELQIHTSFDRVLRVPVYYKTAVGSVKIIPERNIFSPIFPYGLQKLPLRARSYYPQILDIREVQSDPPDERFYFITERTPTIPHLKPQALTELGALVFDPLRGDEEHVYLGTGSSWSAPDYANQLDAKSDRKTFSKLWDTWTALLDDGLTQFNFSFMMYTEIDTAVPIPTEASLVWPSLAARKEIRFLQTTIGNSSTKTLKLTNPSRHPVVVQPILLHYYPQPQRITQLLFETGLIENLNFSLSESSFSLDPDSWGYDKSLKSHTLGPQVGGRGGGGGGEKRDIELRLKFLARESRLVNSLLLLRNNLTGLECVLLQGKGLEGKFSIDGVQPDTGTPLVFQLSSSDLEACSEGTMLSQPLKLTTTFRMHNSGPGTMRIRRIGLGHGGMYDWNRFSVPEFRDDIVIHANKTKKLELSFTPDFSISRVESTLTLQTAEGTTLTFPVVVFLPHSMLAACYSVQPHSEWEERLAYLIVPTWLTILFFVAMFALIRTNFGMISPKTDAGLPAIQPTGGAYFDFGDLMKVLHSTLAEKLDSIKKGVESAQKEQAARKHHERQYKPHNREHRSSSTSSSHSHHGSWSPSHHQSPSQASSSSSPSSPVAHSATAREHEEGSSSSSSAELRRRTNSQPASSSRGETVGRASDGSGGSVKDTRKLDSGGSTATVLSPGPTRKPERNRHMSEPTKKATEQPSRSASTSSHTQPTSPSSVSKVSSSTATTTTEKTQTQTQHMNLSKLELVQPVMTTDQETGMRKLVEQTASNEMPPISPQLQQQHDLSKVKKPAKISVATSSETSGSLPSTPTEGRSSGSSSASSSSAPTPVPQRKGKGVKKSGGGKSQKTTSVLVTTSKPVSSQTTPTPTEPVSAPVTVVPPGETVQDQLERKESDGSLGSTDSESTSSSNSDKSEKDETNVGKTDVEPDPPLAKDQGTGQTIPLLLAQEEFLLCKCKPSPDDESPTSPTEGGSGSREDGAERDGGVGEVQQREKEAEKKEKLPLLPTPRAIGRSKKKLRQQQKKEERLRRKERERERQKDEEEKKKENVHTPDVQGRPHSLAHSLSLEDGEEQHVTELPTKTKKTVATSPKKAKRLELKTVATKADKSPGRSRTAPAKVTIPSRPPTSPPSSASSPSPPAHPTTRSLSKEDAEDSDESPESDRLSHTWAGHELEDMKDSPEPSSPHIQSEPAKSYSRENSEDGTDRQSDGAHLMSSSSHPMEAIPISALRAMRAKGAKQTRAEEEGGGGTTHPLPTTVKKSGMSRKAKDVEKLPPRMARLTEKTAMMPPAVSPQTELKPSPQKKKSIPKIIADDDVSTEGTPALEPTSSQQLLPGKLRSSHMPPTSPHEIATTLLKKRKGKGEGGGRGGSGIGGNSNPHDHEGSDEGDEGKLQTLDEEEEEEEEEGENLSGKVLWAGDSETSPHKRQMRHLHYKTAPTTLSLDAEPFYPSSEYPRGKHARSHPHPHPHHHADTPYAPPGSRRQLNTSPSAFTSPEEIARSFERNYRVREILPPQHLSLHAQHLRHHGNTLTPSPPPSSFPLHSEHPPSSLYYHEGRHGGGIDSSDFPRHSRGPPPDMSTYEISPEEYYSPAPTPTRRVSEGVPHGQRSSRMMRSSTMYDEPLYPGSLHPHSHHHNHPQHAAAYEAVAAHQHRRERAQMMSRGSPNPLWDQHSPYTPQEEEMAQIVRMRQHRLAKLIAQQCSVDALSPLGHQLPPHPRPARSTLYPADTPTSNLWDPAYLDPGAYAHQSDDAFLSDFHQSRHRQRQPQPQEHAVGGVPLQQPRRRRYSSDNELGGELVPDLLQTPSSPSHVSSSGLNKAPGAAFSGMVGARRITDREQELWADNLEKKPSSALTSIWSSSERASNLAFHTNEPATTGERLSAVGSGRNQSSFLENTYDLFQDKSIWGASTETPSTNILPWSQLKSTDLPPADQD
jgi:hypothetical protein